LAKQELLDPWALGGEHGQLKVIDTGAIMQTSGKGCGESYLVACGPKMPLIYMTKKSSMQMKFTTVTMRQNARPRVVERLLKKSNKLEWPIVVVSEFSPCHRDFIAHCKAWFTICLHRDSIILLHRDSTICLRGDFTTPPQGFHKPPPQGGFHNPPQGFHPLFILASSCLVEVRS
jgi:hypothetical protein